MTAIAICASVTLIVLASLRFADSTMKKELGDAEEERCGNLRSSMHMFRDYDRCEFPVGHTGPHRARGKWFR